MARADLHIDLDAIAANWRALDALSAPSVSTAAVVKADSYGLGAATVARKLRTAGVVRFCVAVAEEGATVRKAIGDGPEIFVFGGHMEGDAPLIAEYRLTPMLNSAEQLERQFAALPGAPFGIQLDSGMNRLGMEPAEWAGLRDRALATGPALVMSHLACADEPDHPMNPKQLAAFRAMTDGISAPRSLSATGGILLGPDYHFDMTRPGIGLYGGLPFAEAQPVVRLALPVIQVRDVAAGETVGYGNTWTATTPAKIATVSAGYADGLSRHLSGNIDLWAGDIPCPLRGRVSMDLLTIDVSHLDGVPDTLDLIGPHQGVDAVADRAGTIGYEVLTSLGPRYARHYAGSDA